MKKVMGLTIILTELLGSLALAQPNCVAHVRRSYVCDRVFSFNFDGDRKDVTNFCIPIESVTEKSPSAIYACNDVKRIIRALISTSTCAVNVNSVAHALETTSTAYKSCANEVLYGQF